MNNHNNGDQSKPPTPPPAASFPYVTEHHHFQQSQRMQQQQQQQQQEQQYFYGGNRIRRPPPSLSSPWRRRMHHHSIMAQRAPLPRVIASHHAALQKHQQQKQRYREATNFKPPFHADNEEEEVNKVPEGESAAAEGDTGSMEYSDRAAAPRIRILAVADVDLSSAAQLAEFALRDDNPKEPFSLSSNRSGGGADLCLVVGPIVASRQPSILSVRQQEEELGNEDKNSDDENFDDENAEDENAEDDDGTMQSHQQQRRRRRRQRRRIHDTDNPPGPFMAQNDEEEEEVAAAAEGSATAALSQLESIVCRVVFVPGTTDPSSFLDPLPLGSRSTGAINHSSHKQTGANHAPIPHRRLTPNSRNVHQRWLQLAPGLGVVGIADTLRRRHNHEHDDVAHDSIEVTKNESSIQLREEEQKGDENPNDDDDLDGKNGEDDVTEQSSEVDIDIDQYIREIQSPSSNRFEEDRDSDLKVHNKEQKQKTHTGLPSPHYYKYIQALVRLLHLAPKTSPPPKRSVQTPSSPLSSPPRWLALPTSQAIVLSSFSSNLLRRYRQPEKLAKRTNPTKTCGTTSPPSLEDCLLSSSIIQQSVVLQLMHPALPSIRRMTESDDDSQGQDDDIMDISSPLDQQYGSIRMVHPGSLRSGGYFAMIDLVLLPDPKQQPSDNDLEDTSQTKGDASSGKDSAQQKQTEGKNGSRSTTLHRWIVETVKFRCIDP